MDFSFSEEQQLLRDSLARFVAREYPFEKRRAIVRSAEGFSREIWAQLAEMGLLGLTLPAAHGGFGGTAVDTLVAMQALGGGLVVEPYLASAVLGAGTVARAGTPAQRERLLPAAARGELLLTLAHGEAGARYDLAQVAARARRAGTGFVLDGRKAVVPWGAQADVLVVSARTAGAEREAAGISLFLVERAAKGVSVRGYRTIDGQRAAEVALDGVTVDAGALLGPLDEALPIIERVVDVGAAALCAEAVGVMETLNAQTLDYLKTRQQFGQPIGRFQALQHRAVDMFIHLEQSRSLALLAAVRADAEDAVERARTVSAAKAHLGRSGRLVAQAAIQLHGGMGVTDEMPASHYAKRLTMIDFQLGDADHHAARFAALG
ncbi:MAG: acyl-CoA dehydrogenase family protein [Burkholderiales bacterium]|nr:acyl-CoA dehydrogenase family protein [Burkholderiales bacterium]